MADIFTVTLTGEQENPPVGSAASGSGTVAWDEAALSATYEITVRGLDFGPALGMEPQTADTADDVTMMHVHNAPRGVAGPVVFGQIGPAQDPDDLGIVPNDDGSWTISGVWDTEDPANVPVESFAGALTSAEAGSDVPLYFNVHTPPFPAGEIRGQWVAGGTDEQTGDADGQPVDWEALAARVLAFHEATGSWGLLSDWLSETPPDAPHDGQEEQPATTGDTKAPDSQPGAPHLTGPAALRGRWFSFCLMTALGAS